MLLSQADWVVLWFPLLYRSEDGPVGYDENDPYHRDKQPDETGGPAFEIMVVKTFAYCGSLPTSEKLLRYVESSATMARLLLVTLLSGLALALFTGRFIVRLVLRAVPDG